MIVENFRSEVVHSVGGQVGSGLTRGEQWNWDGLFEKNDQITVLDTGIIRTSCVSHRKVLLCVYLALPPAENASQVTHLPIYVALHRNAAMTKTCTILPCYLPRPLTTLR